MDAKNKLGYMLYLRFTVIWGHKFTASHTNENFTDMWAADWSESLLGIASNDIRKAIEYCRANLEWPPSLAEFRKICEKNSNVPSPKECLNLAVRRDFTHQIVKDIFDKIGSWDMKNAKETELLKRFEKHHKEYLADSRMKKLENDQCNKPKLVHNSTQGSVLDENKHIIRNTSRRTNLRKIEDFLF